MNFNLSLEQTKDIVAEGKYNLIPIFCEVLADLESPVSAYFKLSRDSKNSSFLLESVEGGLHQARFSFIGVNPDDVLTQNGVDPIIEIEKRMEGIKMYPVRDLPSFSGGAMGYFAYDCVKYFEPTVSISDVNNIGVPESVFMFFTTLVVFDHLRHSVKIVSNLDLTGRTFLKNSTNKDTESMYNDTIERIKEAVSLLSTPFPHQSKPVFVDQSFIRPSSTELVSNQGPDGYHKFVNTLKEHIGNGDIIQAVPSQRMSRELAPDTTAMDVYRKLRVVNPSPYMFYINMAGKDIGNQSGFQIVGASPEQLVKVDEKRKVTTHPIAGTRRRGATPEEDLALERELLASEKERAEHIMLVDLGRNDVGRVAKTGTVNVDSLMHIERYSHVMHIVSHVSGTLRDDLSLGDVLRAVFPAGTVSGAPKVRAMQLVSKLENERRGVYAGCVGYFSNGGTLDTAIAIRTLVVKDGNVHLQAGGGIVYDSDAQEEYDETINKMRGAEVAVLRAEKANQDVKRE